MKMNQNFTPTVSMAGVTLPATSAKVMSAGAGAGLYDSFRYKGSLYQVPVGKVLRIWALKVVMNAASGSSIAAIAYGDNGVDNTTSPTNKVTVNIAGQANTLGMIIVANERVELACYCEIPAGKFPCIQSTGSISWAQYLCEEVSV